jgi:hypothetical protein
MNCYEVPEWNCQLPDDSFEQSSAVAVAIAWPVQWCLARNDDIIVSLCCVA